ncbi:putative cytokinetic ring protein SteA [Rarobacter incanus]|uniref:Putative membrane-anchored protein n=1 Tax=Rarobacter incanus TaxID=153494 RepID=A0A542SLP0_9MICO|nr:putative cytokinetic ring protein SteA [Rarobacter incanus]TQK75546.1 putative membrane-anchored protein [Rarobacter incanus]
MNWTRRKAAQASLPHGKNGAARVDGRTKDLVRRLKPGDVAIIDHVDIDRVAAEGLVAAHPAAVLNAAKSISGRYPNLGPSIIVEAGIPLIDNLGGDVMNIREGATVTIDANAVTVNGELVAEGEIQDEDSIADKLAGARDGLSTQLELFAANTMEYLEKERHLLFEGVGVPQVRTPIKDRHALIVVRGYHYREDLIALQSYVKEYRPVLVGVDGGADAILEQGWKPDLIVGDMDSVSDAALRSGAELVVHAYRDGRAPGLERVKSLGLDSVIFPAIGTSEDVAMLLVDDMGADVIVAVGTHATLVEFLDKGRAGMASTFLTRLRVGSKLIDAKGVSRLYRHRISNLQIIILVLAGLFAVGASLAATSAGSVLWELLGAQLDDISSWIVSIFAGG